MRGRRQARWKFFFLRCVAEEKWRVLEREADKWKGIIFSTECVKERRQKCVQDYEKVWKNAWDFFCRFVFFFFSILFDAV